MPVRHVRDHASARRHRQEHGARRRIVHRERRVAHRTHTEVHAEPAHSKRWQHTLQIRDRGTKHPQIVRTPEGRNTFVEADRSETEAILQVGNRWAAVAWEPDALLRIRTHRHRGPQHRERGLRSAFHTLARHDEGVFRSERLFVDSTLGESRERVACARVRSAQPSRTDRARHRHRDRSLRRCSAHRRHGRKPTRRIARETTIVERIHGARVAGQRALAHR